MPGPELLDAEDLAEISPGGPRSVRDWGLLEAAALRVRAGFGDTEVFPGLFDKAAALLEALCRYHPFVDGNKRTAWLGALVFLKINGRMVEAGEDEAVDFMLGVAAGDVGIPAIAQWLEEHSSEFRM